MSEGKSLLAQPQWRWGKSGGNSSPEPELCSVEGTGIAPLRDSARRFWKSLDPSTPIDRPLLGSTVRYTTVRHLVLFVIDFKTRGVDIGGILARLNGEWMRQIPRNLTDGDEGFRKEVRI
jgi:hypothetical protein